MWIKLDGRGAVYQQIFRSLRDSIVGGRIQDGTRLPSSRELASELSVSRNTVMLAYERLLAEGFAAARSGSGTYASAPATGQSRARPHRGTRQHLSSYGERLLESKTANPYRDVLEREPAAIEFVYGLSPMREFPHSVWHRLIARHARAATMRSLVYGLPEGSLNLRQAVCAYLRRARGVVCDVEQVVIVNGFQQALDLLGRILIEPGDAVVLEEPSYPVARKTFLAHGARLIPVGVDAHGITLTEDGGTLPAAKLAYVTPSHQFPTGVELSPRRRTDLLRWATRAGAYVIEDDYDGEFRYGRAVDSLYTTDAAGRVIFVGSFSKVIFPSLRLGYVVLPPPMVAAFRNAKWLADWCSPQLEQEALAEFIHEGHLERYLRRARARCRERRAAMITALRREPGLEVDASDADAGLHLVVWLRDFPRELLGALVAKARASGVGVYPVDPCFHTPVGRAGLLMGYSTLSARDIEEGVRRLAASARAVRRTGSLAG